MDRKIRVVIEIDEKIECEVRRFKFLLDESTSAFELMLFIRRKLSLRPQEAIFIFSNNYIVTPTQSMAELFVLRDNKNANEMILKVKTENAFGVK